jgi:hypothetical protein
MQAMNSGASQISETNPKIVMFILYLTFSESRLQIKQIN